VSWIEQAAPGSSAEPEHPAPVLQLAAGSSSAGASAPISHTSSSSSGSSGRATTGIVLGIIGIVLGGGALVLVLRRRPASG
jgi:uncharacterized protein